MAMGVWDQVSWPCTVIVPRALLRTCQREEPLRLCNLALDKMKGIDPQNEGAYAQWDLYACTLCRTCSDWGGPASTIINMYYHL